MLTSADSPPAPTPDGRPRLRHPLVLGTVAAVAALVAAVGAAALVDASRPGGETPALTEPPMVFTPEDREQPALVEGDPQGDGLPDTPFTDLDGQVSSFAAYRGRPLVVNFFASNCAPCITEMPALEQVHLELDGSVAFLGMNLRDQVAAARDLVERTGVTYDIGRDPSGALFASVGGLVMPTTFFVSPEGVVLEAHAGAMSADDLRAAVDRHFS